MTDAERQGRPSFRPRGSQSPADDVYYSYAFQPIVDVAERTVFSYEALIRGANGEPPGHVLSRFQGDDLLEFDQYAKDSALDLAARLNIDCYINLNFLPRSIEASDAFIRETERGAARNNLRLNQIVIEVTETEVIDNRDRFSGFMDQCRELGIKTAIDDFGAGYSGLNLLTGFQPDLVKLDMQLVRGIESHGPRQAIVNAVSLVCFDLGIDIIAEGVETVDEYRWLREHHIDLYQGYLLAKPGFESLPEVRYPD